MLSAEFKHDVVSTFSQTNLLWFYFFSRKRPYLTECVALYRTNDGSLKKNYIDIFGSSTYLPLYRIPKASSSPPANLPYSFTSYCYVWQCCVPWKASSGQGFLFISFLFTYFFFLFIESIYEKVMSFKLLAEIKIMLYVNSVSNFYIAV